MYSPRAHAGGALDALEQEATRARTTVVYDLGGGTFDVTVLRFEPGHLQVLATAGDVQLGGRDWDRRLAEHLAELFMGQHRLDPREDAPGPEALQRQQTFDRYLGPAQGEVLEIEPGIRTIYIRPGSYIRGTPGGTGVHGTDQTQHEVTLNRGFYLGWVWIWYVAGIGLDRLRHWER